MTFTVTVRLPDGREDVRTVEAENRMAVYELVEKEGVGVLSIEEAPAQRVQKLGKVVIGTGIKAQERFSFAKNLAAMLTAGLTLSRALSVMARQSRNRFFIHVVQELETSVKSGMPFNGALAQHPKVFSRLFVAMAKAGEESGTLATSLAAVGAQMEATYALMKKVKGALIYPAIIIVAIIVIAVLMLMYVVPTLSNTFASLGAELPFATRAILGISTFMTQNAILVLGCAIALLIGGILLVRSRFGRGMILAVALHLPVIGTLVRETYSARAARTLASLLSGGVDMLTALSITGEVVGSNRFGVVVLEAEERVRKGEALSAAFNSAPNLYPAFFTEMIMVGEETGTVAEMLGQVARYYEAEVDAGTKDLSTIIEPILMLLIGLAVGVFALAMIAPIYSLSNVI